MEVKYHTLIKHKILGEYLKSCDIAFRKKDGSKGKYGDFVFVETHAGDGEAYVIACKKSFDGSAIIAAKIDPEFPCFLIENDSECIKKLKAKSIKYTNISIREGDCNKIIKDVLRELPEDCVSVVFVDPKNYKEVSWDTIEEIKNHNKTDLVLNFPLGILRREIEIKNAWKGIDKFFGTHEWVRHKDNIIELVKFYLKRLGYKYMYIHLVKAVKTNVPLYLVVLGTDSYLGRNIGSWIWSKTIRKWVEEVFPRIVYQVKSLDEFMKDNS